jgi:uncharacterized membrane protein YphA (DoxX/SURF4 family)
MSAIRSILLERRAIRLMQVVIGILFGVAALAKLADLPAFATQVHNFRVLPVALENLVAMLLPWVELVAALSLVLGIRARSGAVVTVALLAVFTLGVTQAVARGLDFECGCFGTGDGTRVGAMKILQNLAMLAVALVASRGPNPSGAREASPAGSRARTLSSEI